MVLFIQYIICILDITQFTPRILTFLTLCNYMSVHIYQIHKISEISLHRSVWSTSAIDTDTAENLKLQEVQ